MLLLWWAILHVHGAQDGYVQGVRCRWSRVRSDDWTCVSVSSEVRRRGGWDCRRADCDHARRHRRMQVGRSALLQRGQSEIGVSRALGLKGATPCRSRDRGSP